MIVTERRAVLWIKSLERLQGLEDLRFGQAGQPEALKQVDLLDRVAWLHITALHPGIYEEKRVNPSAAVIEFYEHNKRTIHTVDHKRKRYLRSNNLRNVLFLCVSPFHRNVSKNRNTAMQ